MIASGRAVRGVIGAASAVALLVVAAVALAGTGAAGTQSFIEGDFNPGKVSKSNFEDGKLSIALRLYNSQGPNPNDPNTPPNYELEQLEIDIDDDIKLKPSGINPCDDDLSESSTDEALALCGPAGDDAKLGKGEAIISYFFGGRAARGMFDFAPILYHLTAFNGPEQNGHPTVLLHLHQITTAMVEDTVVISAEIVRSSAGVDFGKRLYVADMPTLSMEPSSGSPDAGLLSLKWSMKRGAYASARCRDANKDWDIRAKFTYYDSSTNSDKHASACSRN